MPIVMDALALDYESLVHFVPTTAQRKSLAKSGVAMPDGSFYIRKESELSDAIKAVGRATPNAGESDTARRNAVRRHIIKRAAALNLSSMIPDTWNSDGTLKQSAIMIEEIEEYLEHFGRKGMKWGEHIFGRDRGGSSGSHDHPDAIRARTSLATARTHGSSALSSHDLRDLNNRLQLERQFSQLTAAHKSEGRKFVEGFAKQQVAALAAKHGPAGIAWVAKHVAKAVVSTGKHAA